MVLILIQIVQRDFSLLSNGYDLFAANDFKTCESSKGLQIQAKLLQIVSWQNLNHALAWDDLEWRAVNIHS